MKYIFTFLAILSLSSAFAKEEKIRAILLLGHPSHVLDASFTKEIEGIFIEELEIPGDEKALKAYLDPFLNTPLNKKALEHIEDEIFAHYRELGIKDIQITIPIPAIKNGVIQLIIEKKPAVVAEVSEPTVLEPQQTVRGIIILSQGDRLFTKTELDRFEGIWINLLSLPVNEKTLETLLEGAIGSPFEEASLNAIRSRILNLFESAGLSIELVPHDDFESGTVQILVREKNVTPAPTFAILKEETPLSLEEVPLATLTPPPAQEVASPAEASPLAVAETPALEEPLAVIEEPTVNEPLAKACETKEPTNEKTKGPKLKGIVLLNGHDPLLDSESLEGIEGILASSFAIPGNECELGFNLEKLLNEPFDDETLTKVQEEIYEFYRASDRPFVLVDVPEQKEETGVAQIIVQESTLGKVCVVGNKWTKSSRYENYFSMRPGDPISQRSLNRSVDFMNRNPYRFVNVIYSPGEKEYTTDLMLEVADRKPYFFYAGIDNTGVPTTGRARVFAGFSWDQMFGLDQTFFYQYSTNYSSQKYHSNSFQYMVMLPYKAILNLFGGFSLTHADLNPAPASNKGTSVQGSVRYVTPFGPKAHFSQELVAGFDIKNTNNTIEFTDLAPVIGHTVNITQFMFGYKCKYEWMKIDIEGGLDGVFSPFAWLPNQTDADFQSLRPDATHTWFYTTGYCHLRRALPHSFSTVVKVNAQYSMSTLLPSEQIGLGGFASVRGYDERQYNGDSGMILNWEVHTPHFPVFHTKKRSLNNDAYFLLFADGGFAIDNHLIDGIPRANSLASAGAGFRYYLGTYLSGRVDFGVKLHHQDDFTSGWSHTHFSVSGSF